MKPRKATRARLIEATGATYMDRFGYAPIGLAAAHILGAVLEDPRTAAQIAEATRLEWVVGYQAVHAAILRAERSGLVQRSLADGTLRWAYVATPEGRAAYHAHKAARRVWDRMVKG